MNKDVMNSYLRIGRNPSVRGLTKFSTVLILMLVMAMSAFGEEGLVIETVGKQPQPVDAERVYASACLAVERQFGISRPVRPRVKLILGTREVGAYSETREIKLARWDPYMFAQGVVIFAFQDLLPEGERLAVARRAVTWADSTTTVRSLSKR